MKKYILILLCLLGSFSSFAAVEFPPRPDPPKLVNDFTNTLAEEDISRLERQLVAFDDSTSVQIAVVLISTLDGYPISDYAFELGEKWGVGDKKKNSGALLLIAINDHKLFIATGYGLEATLPDARCRNIIENDITPAFKKGLYYEGIQAGTEKMMQAVKGDYKDTPRKKSKGAGRIPAVLIIILVFLFIFLAKIFSVRRYSILNNIPFWVAWSLLNAAAGRRKGRWSDFSGGRGSFGGWSGGGGFGGGSSGGGGFGGFGGGSFGGGGAGGSW